MSKLLDTLAYIVFGSEPRREPPEPPRKSAVAKLIELEREKHKSPEPPEPWPTGHTMSAPPQRETLTVLLDPPLRLQLRASFRHYLSVSVSVSERDPIVKVGSLPSAQLQLPDGPKMHSVVEWTKEGVFIIDLGSESPVLVNGKREYKSKIRHGDVLTLAGHAVNVVDPDAIVQLPPPPGPRAASSPPPSRGSYREPEAPSPPTPAEVIADLERQLKAEQKERRRTEDRASLEAARALFYVEQTNLLSNYILSERSRSHVLRVALEDVMTGNVESPSYESSMMRAKKALAAERAIAAMPEWNAPPYGQPVEFRKNGKWVSGEARPSYRDEKPRSKVTVYVRDTGHEEVPVWALRHHHKEGTDR